MRFPGRRTLARLALALIVFVAVPWCLGDGSPVGHFASAADTARFIAAYDRAMAALPRPQQVRDLRTGYGIVRVYRFAGVQTNCRRSCSSPAAPRRRLEHEPVGDMIEAGMATYRLKLPVPALTDPRRSRRCACRRW